MKPCLSLAGVMVWGMPPAVYGARYTVSCEGLVINNLSSTVPFLSRTLVYSGVMSTQGRVQSMITKNPLFLPGFSPYYYMSASIATFLREGKIRPGV